MNYRKVYEFRNPIDDTMKKILFLPFLIIPFTGMSQCGFDNNGDGFIEYSDLLSFLTFYGAPADCEPTPEPANTADWSSLPNVINESVHAEAPYTSMYNMIIQENEPIYIDRMSCINVYSIGGKSGRNISTNEIIGSYIEITAQGGASNWVEIYIEDNLFDFPNVHLMFQNEENVDWGWVIVNEGNPDEDASGNLIFRDTPCVDNCPPIH